jgi:hypothetical protein
MLDTPSVLIYIGGIVFRTNINAHVR